MGQFTSTPDAAANLATLQRQSRKAAASGAGLIVFPEAAMYDWRADAAEVAAAAQSSGARFADDLSRIAADAGIAIVAGGFVPSGGPTPFNRMLAVDAAGQPMGQYDKLHLYDAFSYRESEKVQPAQVRDDMSELTVIELGGFRFGLLNCYDLRFPEMARALIQAGADSLIISSAWVAGPHKELHWETLLRARAIENTCYVLASNQPPPFSVGLSMIVDPMGLPAATVTESEGIALARITRARLDEVTAVVPSVSQRRYAIVPADRT